MARDACRQGTRLKWRGDPETTRPIAGPISGRCAPVWSWFGSLLPYARHDMPGECTHVGTFSDACRAAASVGSLHRVRLSTGGFAERLI